MKRLLALLLCLLVTVSMLTGCSPQKDPKSGPDAANTPSTANTPSAEPSDGEPSTQKAGTDEYVELKMYLLGDRAADFDEVYGKINEILKEKVNATVSVDFLSWGEHDTKYSLLFSGQEDFDLIFTATTWAHYEKTVAMGGFFPITEEFIQTYAPDIWEVVPNVAWDQARIDGSIYMVPGYNNEFGQDVIAVRGDLIKKYGIEKITSWDELKAFYEACAADGIYASSRGGPWYQYFQAKGMGNVGGTPKAGELILHNAHDLQDTSFYYILDWDGFADYCKQAKALADAGAWSSDVLNMQDDRQTGLLTGKAAGMIWNLGSCRTYAKQANQEHPEWEVTIFDPASHLPKQTTPYINNGVAINVGSKHKERAMMVLNEFYTNKEINELAMLGIEGKHWEAVGDDQYKLLDQTGYVVDNNCNWGWRNQTITRKEFIESPTALDKRYDELLAAWNANIKEPHPYFGFNFDNSKVTTQVAAVEANIATYYDPLTNGLVDDVDATIAEFKNALDVAGIRDILAELETQAAAYLEKKQAN